MSLSKSKKLEYCAQCRDNFYNGHNSLGVKECWSLKSAKVVKKKLVHINQRPPWSQEPIKVLSCCHIEGHVLVSPNQTN